WPPGAARVPARDRPLRLRRRFQAADAARAARWRPAAAPQSSAHDRPRTDPASPSQANRGEGGLKSLHKDSLYWSRQARMATDRPMMRQKDQRSPIMKLVFLPLTLTALLAAMVAALSPAQAE